MLKIFAELPDEDEDVLDKEEEVDVDDEEEYDCLKRMMVMTLSCASWTSLTLCEYDRERSQDADFKSIVAQPGQCAEPPSLPSFCLVCVIDRCSSYELLLSPGAGQPQTSLRGRTICMRQAGLLREFIKLRASPALSKLKAG